MKSTTTQAPTRRNEREGQGHDEPAKKKHPPEGRRRNPPDALPNPLPGLDPQRSPGIDRPNPDRSGTMS